VKEIVRNAVKRQQDITTRLKRCKIGQNCQGDPRKPSKWRLYSPQNPPHIERNDWHDPCGIAGYPMYVILDDRAAVNVLESGISNKDRHFRWPGNFTTSGDLPKDHVHRGHTGRVADGRFICIDFGKRHKYVFHGDENYNDGDPVKFIEVVSGRPGTELSYHLSTPQTMQKAADLEALEASRKEAAEAVPRATAMLQQMSMITKRLNEELECASTTLDKCRELAAKFQYDPMSYDTEQERSEALRRMAEDLASWGNDLERRDARAGPGANELDEERAGNDEAQSSSANRQIYSQRVMFEMQVIQLYQKQQKTIQGLKTLYEKVPKCEENRELLLAMRNDYHTKRDDLQQWRKSLDAFEWISAALDLYIHPDGDNLDWSGNDLDIDEGFFHNLRMALAAEGEGDDDNEAADDGIMEDDGVEDWDDNLGLGDASDGITARGDEIENAGDGTAKAANDDLTGNEKESTVNTDGKRRKKSREKGARRGKKVPSGVGEATEAVHEQAEEQQDVVENARSAKKARKAERKAWRNSTTTGEDQRSGSWKPSSKKNSRGSGASQVIFHKSC